MASRVPIVRQVSWLATIPQLLALGVSTTLFSPLGRWPVAAVTGVAALLVVAPAHGSGFGDLRALAADMVLLALGLAAAIDFAIFVGVSKRHTLWSLRRALLFGLVTIASAAAVLALNNLLWDQLYSGPYYLAAAMSLALLYPLTHVAFLRFFRRQRAEREVARICGIVAAVIAAIGILFVIGEKLL